MCRVVNVQKVSELGWLKDLVADFAIILKESEEY